MSTTEAPALTRWEKSEITRTGKLNDLFQGRRYRILREIHLTGGQQFQTPLGHWGKDGFALVEVDVPGNKFFVGIHLLAKVVRDYDAIVDPPAPIAFQEK